MWTRGMAPRNRRKGTRLKWGGTNNSSSNSRGVIIGGEGGSTPSTTTIREHHFRERSANISLDTADKNRFHWAIKNEQVLICVNGILPDLLPRTEREVISYKRRQSEDT